MNTEEQKEANRKLYAENQKKRFAVQTDKSFAEMFPDDPSYGKVEISLPLACPVGDDWFKVGVSFPDSFARMGTHMGASLNWEQAKWIKHVIYAHDGLLRQRDALLIPARMAIGYLKKYSTEGDLIEDLQTAIDNCDKLNSK